MGINNSHRIIIFVFSVSLMVSFFNASVNENSQKYVPCKPEWYSFSEKCYKILPLDRDLSYTNSIDSCTLEGGNLASIHSSELQEFLTVILLLNSKSNAWIGLHDRVSDSEYSWVDGSIYNYTNWDSNQPSSLNTFTNHKEHCVEMRYENFKDSVGAWNDEACSSLRRHICQVKKSDDTKSPDPRFCSIEDNGGWKYLNSCYHVVKEEKSWEDAEKYCEEKYKGYLVSILNDNAEIFLNYIMKLSNISKHIWIGIKMGNYSTQKWTSGWHVANKRFNQEQLHFVNGTCVMKTNWNSWGIAPCHNTYPFICEKIKYNVPVLQKPPSEDWECPYSGKNWLDLGGDSCYYIENELSQTWQAASYDCGRKGGTLTSFNSENETYILHPFLLNKQERMFIGLKRNSVNNDVFEWSDGTKLIYQNWHKGEPNNQNEACGELWTASMKWNDIPCNLAKGYICKTQKRISKSKFKKSQDQVPCNSALSKDQTYSSGIPLGIVVGIVICALFVGLLVGVIVYHYQDYWKINLKKAKNNVCTSMAPGSLGAVSEKVIWRPQEEEIHC